MTAIRSSLLRPRWFWLLLLIPALGCDRDKTAMWQGYIEGEYVYIGSPLAGTLQSRPVERGQQVKAGDMLFTLEQESEQAAVTEAERRLAEARANLENLTKGRRPTEIEALSARLAEAKANLELAKSEYERRKRLFENNVIATGEWDQARSQRDAAQAQVEMLTADLETARLGARPDEIIAAAAEAEARTAVLAKARWAVTQKTVKSSITGVVHDTLYRPGEWVPAGNPVVALLPPENIKVRFFVPERQIATLSPGNPLEVTLDGRTNSYSARVTYISTRAEFTPPVVYSRETRSKLVYMVEATFDASDARQLRPGQPVDVRPKP